MTVGGRVLKKFAQGYRLLKGKEVKVRELPKPKPLPPKAEPGIEIPSFKPSLRIKLPAAKEVRKTLIYPLVPRKPKPGEPVFAYCKISWNPELNRYVYELVEPPLPKHLKTVLEHTKRLLEERLEVELAELRKVEAIEQLHKQADELIDYFKFRLSPMERAILHYYVERDFAGFGRVDALMRDPNLEDISCDGVNLPIHVFHRDPHIASVITNVKFEDAKELDSFIVRLAQLCGKSISILQPLVDGTLPDGSRLQATLATDIARKGSHFTIRKFRKEPLTPVDLLNYHTVDAKVLAYLWYVLEQGRSVLVSGGTAAGKTAFLNMLSLFIRPEKKIISIEDTAEINLPHPHWVSTVARTPIARKPGEEVDLYALLRASLRARPDYLIVGEVRGPEAYILFQQIATGHPSLATIHAESLPRLVDRLTSPPISLPLSLVASLDLVVFLSAFTYREHFVRKVTEVLEIVGFSAAEQKLQTNTLFKWDPFTDSWRTLSKSRVLEVIAQTKAVQESELKEELQRRMLVLNWMWEQNINYYKDVYKVICNYYADPARVLAAISG